MTKFKITFQPPNEWIIDILDIGLFSFNDLIKIINKQINKHFKENLRIYTGLLKTELYRIFLERYNCCNSELNIEVEWLSKC
jgi:hypothetical protein